MTSLKGKLFVITGAASGIGRATAKLLASRGARLCLADINEEELIIFASELVSLGSEVRAHCVDVSNRSEVELWIKEIMDHFHRPIDGAANLAGIIPSSAFTEAGSVRNVDDEVVDQVMNVNCKGVLNCVRAQLPHLKAGENGVGGGSIVNAASAAALVGFPMNVAYGMSKHAVAAITKCAAKEEGKKGIRVNAICP
jgi:NAD(P)-dependent dehydrogenase (short-subunit alcohol dehydrogenase family)